MSVKTHFPSAFEHFFTSVSDLTLMLKSLGIQKAILKPLPKNANDKNQIYFASDFSVLYNLFDITLAERGPSFSSTKDSSTPGSLIPEGVFNDFSWCKRDGTLVKAKNVKVIIYTQYPEARLSGFISVENDMPQSLSVSFMKDNPECKRILVLGSLPGGVCIALVIINYTDSFAADVAALPGMEGSRICKQITIEQDHRSNLLKQLSGVVKTPQKGCRLDAYGNTLPFTGTQVCGYTLEHALGIVPNSDKDGDINGIELKTHTQEKVTLFTPEPDFGPYTDDFAKFMMMYGYQSAGKNEYRLTGVHRANERNKKTGLTLKIREYRPANPDDKKSDWVRDANGDKVAFPYDSSTSLTSKLNAVEVVLEDDAGKVAAGWSLTRLMNTWGVKHNDVVYLSASKMVNEDQAEREQGYAFKVRFEPKVILCQQTSAEHLLKAINDGVIFLDPAPKYVPDDVSKNKRRSQWRVNDISKAVCSLYDDVQMFDLGNI